MAEKKQATRHLRSRSCFAWPRSRKLKGTGFSDLVGSSNQLKSEPAFFLQRILQATLNTLNGLRAAASSEAAFRQELIALAIAVPMALVIATDLWMRVALIGVVLALLIVELLNTAIEKLADRVTLEHDPMIGRVKDMGSAAVGLTLLLAGFVWLVALWERIAALLA